MTNKINSEKPENKQKQKNLRLEKALRSNLQRRRTQLHARTKNNSNQPVVKDTA